MWRRLLEEGGWGKIHVGLAMAVALAGGGLIYQQVSQNGASPPDEGWLLTTSNVGLAPHGLTCAGLTTYTTNPVPADTHIYQKRIVWSSGGYLDLNAGGITIEQSCIQPTQTAQLVTVQSYPVNSNPNVIIDSEVDGSLIATEDIGKACALRGIWSNISRNYVHDVGSGICHVDYDDSLSYDMLVQSNYVLANIYFGDPGTTGSHNEASTERCARIDINPSRTTKWIGNWLRTVGNSSGGMFLQTPPGYGCPVGNMYLQDNYLDGGGNFDVYGDGTSYSGDFVMTNNRFEPGGFGSCAAGGTLAWTSVSGNYVYDSGNPPTYSTGGAVSC